jgi:hypothetical protein
MGTGSFPGLKRPGRDADHTPPSSAEVTKGYSYTSIHPLGLFRPVIGLLYLFLLLLDDADDDHHTNTLSTSSIIIIKIMYCYASISHH